MANNHDFHTLKGIYFQAFKVEFLSLAAKSSNAEREKLFEHYVHYFYNNPAECQHLTDTEIAHLAGNLKEDGVDEAVIEKLSEAFNTLLSNQNQSIIEDTRWQDEARSFDLKGGELQNFLLDMHELSFVAVKNAAENPEPSASQLHRKALFETVLQSIKQLIEKNAENAENPVAKGGLYTTDIGDIIRKLRQDAKDNPDQILATEQLSIGRMLETEFSKASPQSKPSIILLK